MDIDYQEKLRRHLDQLEALDQNMAKAYSLIYSNNCMTAMQLRIEAHPDFDLKIKDNPVALLEAIKILTHDAVRAQYPVISLQKSLKMITNIKQGENEGVNGYVKLFKQTLDILRSHIDKKPTDGFAEHEQEYKKETNLAKKTAYKLKLEERWLARVLLDGADNMKHGFITKGLTSQSSLGNDQYPYTIEGATDILIHHRWDTRYH